MKSSLLLLGLALCSSAGAQERHATNSKSNHYAQTAVVGGQRSDGRTVEKIESAPLKAGEERVTLSLKEGLCSYRVEKAAKGITVTVTGVRRFSAVFPKPVGLIAGYQKLAYEDDSGFKFLIQTRKPVDFEVFQRVKPAQIVIDLKAP